MIIAINEIECLISVLFCIPIVKCIHSKRVHSGKENLITQISTANSRFVNLHESNPVETETIYLELQKFLLHLMLNTEK